MVICNWLFTFFTFSQFSFIYLPSFSLYSKPSCFVIFTLLPSSLLHPHHLLCFSLPRRLLAFSRRQNAAPATVSAHFSSPLPILLHSRLLRPPPLPPPFSTPAPQPIPLQSLPLLHKTLLLPNPNLRGPLSTLSISLVGTPQTLRLRSLPPLPTPQSLLLPRLLFPSSHPPNSQLLPRRRQRRPRLPILGLLQAPLLGRVLTQLKELSKSLIKFREEQVGHIATARYTTVAQWTSRKAYSLHVCGSRWRTKGTLTNYTPLHARAEIEEHEDHRLSKVITVYPKIGEEKLKKRKLSYDYNHGFLESIDEEDTSNGSSSGSAVSNSECLVQFSSADFTVPSKKRSSVTRMMSSSVEKLVKDLHAILHEQQSSHPCGSYEEDLLFESDVPMVSVEIGHGSVLIKHPSSFACEEEEEDSEASSLTFENRPCFNGGNAYYNGSENVTKFRGEMMQQEPAKRDQFSHDRMQHLLTHNSPLGYIDSYDSKSPNQTQEIEVESESKLSSSKDLQNLNLQVILSSGKETNEGHKRGLNKFGLGSKEPMHKYGAFFTPGTTDSCHIMLESCHDQDLLLDVPFNGCFPEAELLLPPSSSSIHSAMIHH